MWLCDLVPTNCQAGGWIQDVILYFVCDSFRA